MKDPTWDNPENNQDNHPPEMVMVEKEYLQWADEQIKELTAANAELLEALETAMKDVNRTGFTSVSSVVKMDKAIKKVRGQ